MHSPTMKALLMSITLTATATSAQVLTPLTTSESFQQRIADRALFATTSSGAEALASGTSTRSFTGFDANVGVLVGVSGTLAVDTTVNAGTGAVSPYLRAFVSEGQRNSASVSANWAIGSVSLSGQTLVNLPPANDVVAYAHSNAWQAVSFTSAANDAFVQGIGTKSSSITSTIDVTASKVASPNSPLQGYITSSTNTNLGGDFTALNPTATVTLDYQYLKHATAQVNQGGTVHDWNVVNGDGASFSIFNGRGESPVPDSGISGMSFAGVACTAAVQADCDAISFSLAAGTVITGNDPGLGVELSFAGAAGLQSADGVTLTLNFTDSDGLASTRQNTAITVFVTGSTVTAVPEPHPAGLLLAGLGALGWLSRRRRPSGSEQL